MDLSALEAQGVWLVVGGGRVQGRDGGDGLDARSSSCFVVVLISTLGCYLSYAFLGDAIPFVDAIPHVGLSTLPLTLSGSMLARGLC